MKRVANTGDLLDDPNTPIKWVDVEVEEQEDCRCAEFIEMLHGDCKYCKTNNQPWECEGCKYGMGICDADKWELKETGE